MSDGREWNGLTLRQKIETIGERNWRVLEDGRIEADGMEPFRVVGFPTNSKVNEEIAQFVRAVLNRAKENP